MNKKEMKKDIVLVLSSGGLRGAISAGFVATICRELGIEYFSTVYCYSVGVYAGTFGVANQPDIIEKVWRDEVDGKKLVNIYKMFTFGWKKILNLDYLKEMFSSGEFKLDVKKALSSKAKLRYVLIKNKTGKINFVTPTKENIFDLMNAACAIPVAYGPYEVEGSQYLDTTFVSGIHEGLDKIVKKHRKIVFVSNFHKDYTKYKEVWYGGLMKKYIFPIFAKLYPKPCQEKFKVKYYLMEKEKVYLQNNKKVILIAPKENILKSGRDTNRERINLAFGEGVKLARQYILSLKK